MAKITDRQARTIKPGGRAIPTGITGLTLQPSTKPGRGKWNLRFVSPMTGKRRDMGLGVYPDTGVSDALSAADRARQQIAAGIDPIVARDDQQSLPSFEQAARARWEQVSPAFRNEKHRAQWISSLERHVFPYIGAYKVDALTPRHFADMLRRIWLEIPETAKRVKMRCADIMASCWAHGHIQSNPLDVVAHLLPATKSAATIRHQPAMPWQLVQCFVNAHLAKEPLLGARAALLFAILTAARSGEVRGATWGEIDFHAKLWVIPASRMKAGKDHRVPLSRNAIKLLRQLNFEAEQSTPEELIFPALRGGQLSDMALTSLLRKAKAPSDTPGRVATAHGFRSSFRDWAADKGYSTELAERALAHLIGNKVQAAYERTDRLEARINMMEDWADWVMSTQATSSKNVLSLRSA